MSTARAPQRVEPRRRIQPSTPPDRHLRVVRTPSRLPARRRVVTFLAIGLLFVALLSTVASHVLLLQGQQRINRLTERNAAAQQRYDQLRIQVDRLESPDRIVQEAQKQGMKLPAEQIWLTPSSPSPVTTPSTTASTSPANDSADVAHVKPYLGTSK